MPAKLLTVLAQNPARTGAVALAVLPAGRGTLARVDVAAIRVLPAPSAALARSAIDRAAPAGSGRLPGGDRGGSAPRERRARFALAVAGALVAHGVISRPTQDLDLFTPTEGGPGEVSAALLAALTDTGCRVQMLEGAELHGGEFMRLQVHRDEHVLDIDLARDWRQHPPVRRAPTAASGTHAAADRPRAVPAQDLTRVPAGWRASAAA